MSVSHVAPPHLGLHRHRTHRVSGSVGYHGRARIIFGLIGVLLAALLVLAFIGLLSTVQYTSTTTSGTVQNLQISHMAMLWLWVALMDVVAILAYLISWAYRA